MNIQILDEEGIEWILRQLIMSLGENFGTDSFQSRLHWTIRKSARINEFEAYIWWFLVLIILPSS